MKNKFYQQGISYLAEKKILLKTEEKELSFYLPSSVEKIEANAFSKCSLVSCFVLSDSQCKDFSPLCRAKRAYLIYLENEQIISYLPLSGVCGFEPFISSSFPNYEGYDQCFYSVKEEKQRIDMAIHRLYYPEGLTVFWREKYEKFLIQKYRVAIKWVIEEKSIEFFYWLFSFRIPDRYMLREFKLQAMENNKTEIVLFLMDSEQKNRETKVENFEL